MRWILLACAALLFLFVSRAQGQVPDTGPEVDAKAVENSPLLLLVPEARNFGAPDWVKTGTRITFYGMAGSTPQGGYTLDPDANGEWEDPATGQRYKKNDAIGSGGEGFGQWDVISVGKSGVALTCNLYTIIERGNPPTLLHTPLGGMTAAACGPADLWVHPTILANAKQFHTPGFFMLKGNYPIGQTVYPSLCIVRRAPDSYSSHAYDLRSGVLVSSTVTAEGQTARLHLPNEDAQRGNKATTIVKFVSIRQLDMPGINGKNPDWSKNIRAMHFAGQSMFVNKFDPSIRMNWPVRMDVSFGKRGENWCMWESAVVAQMQNMPPQTTGSKGVCGPAGPFWIDPTALANLRVGQVLDDDPVTHIRIAVTAIDGQRIAISTQGPGVGGQGIFDLKTGMLQALTALQPSSGITIQMQLQGTE